MNEALIQIQTNLRANLICFPCSLFQPRLGNQASVNLTDPPHTHTKSLRVWQGWPAHGYTNTMPTSLWLLGDCDYGNQTFFSSISPDLWCVLGCSCGGKLKCFMGHTDQSKSHPRMEGESVDLRRNLQVRLLFSCSLA